VSDGKIPVSVMEEYALAVNVKAHGNAKIPCSRLMRAVIATGLTEGTPTPQRKLARASTYASAIDYGIREGMSTEAFAAELDQSRKRGEHHGIEYLAAKGREVRKNANTEQSGDEIARALDGLNEGGAFSVSGDFTSVEPGYRLVIINVPAETTIVETRGQIIDLVDDKLV
jgi:hypothetical protein